MKKKGGIFITCFNKATTENKKIGVPIGNI
jgi:hypothetical protein